MIPLGVFRATTPAIRDRSWAVAPASERIRRQQTLARRLEFAVRAALAAILLLGLLFGVPLVLGALAVALGMPADAGLS